MAATNAQLATVSGLDTTQGNTLVNLATTNVMIRNGTTGMAQQVAGSGLTVGGATGGTTLSVAGTDGARSTTGVADGTVAAGSQQAVNGGQLAATNTRVTSVEGRATAVERRTTAVESTVVSHGNRVTLYLAPCRRWSPKQQR